MSRLFVISDLHLDHKKILEFCPNRVGTSLEEHNEWLVSQWNSVVKKRVQVYVLGDVAFSQESLDKYLSRMIGIKHMVRGNHDKFDTALYLKYFKNVYGLVKKRGFWMSHAPIHPQELRGKRNIHGHVHNNSVSRWNPAINNWELDPNYINACVDACNGIPICLARIVTGKQIGRAHV